MKTNAIRWTIFVLAALAATSPAPSSAASARRARRLLVTFAADASRADRDQASRAMGLRVAEDLDALQMAVLDAPEGPGARETALAMRNPKVLSVEEDVYRNWLLDAPAVLPAAMPTVEAALKDLGRPHELPADGRVPWGVARVDAPRAWSSGQGAGVKVAVIDTGIDCRHPDLGCDFHAGVNMVEPGAAPMDDNEHGTHVAGTIAGRGRGSGVLGVAPRATLIPVKVLDADGAGSLSDIIKGVDWATRSGADVVNMSLGGDVDSPALERAVERALSAGVIVVCAAGNSGPDPDTVGFPAGYPGVIAVGASDKRDRIAPFSSRGPAVALVAPGVDIVSTVPGGGVGTLSGTSMAAPHVAGLAALAVERGARGPARARRALEKAAARLPGAAPAEEGAGLVDAARLR